MNVKHRFFFHGSRKNGRSKNKNHAQDGGTLIGVEISVRRSCHGFMFRMASILIVKSRAPCPSSPAAGLLLDAYA
jgi:hypothetical protein